ncbi:ABC transporter substrate-binding protein [Marinobacter daepoensis]|uniref:ABC transporter substrate-binding protein n=1 Tax=Marinobacter daepoensis TaxID=262077 RepID=UPI0003F86345|nr:ABC transporter substrate-binding protein [Marinobacter daepoensis]
MKPHNTLLAGAFAGLMLAGCASTPDLTRPTVISYDHGALDTLLELGLEGSIQAVPKQGLPDYLADVAGRWPDAGSLKAPDQSLISDLRPGLVLMTGRQGADAQAAAAKVAPVRDITLSGETYQEAVNARVIDLAHYFGLEQAAGIKLNELWQYVGEQKAALSSAGTVTVVTHNEGRFSLRQEALVYEVLGLTPAVVPESVQPIERGARTFYPVTTGILADMAPDTLLVVDRSAAIGATPLEPQVLQSALAQAGAQTRVVVLDPGLWYLSGAGLKSVRLQVDEVVSSVR